MNNYHPMANYIPDYWPSCTNCCSKLVSALQLNLGNQELQPFQDHFHLLALSHLELVLPN